MRRGLVVAAVIVALTAAFVVGRQTAPQPSAEDVARAERDAALEELAGLRAPSAFDLGTPLQAVAANLDAVLATDPLDVSRVDDAAVERLEQYNAPYVRYPFHRFVRDAVMDARAGVDGSDRNRLARARDVIRGVIGAISLDVQVLAEARAAGDDDPSHVPVWANIEGAKTGTPN